MKTPGTIGIHKNCQLKRVATNATMTKNSLTQAVINRFVFRQVVTVTQIETSRNLALPGNA